ncbi:sigma factor SigX-regulated lipoprotein SrpC [Leptospira noguchii]|uniref:sigma factor SigX-regulated lipoprotein SrpC n=1 Tax=Leptospira noguchii TaxID=28182 RepID=UPI0018E22DBA|nr:hypothetical protein [Leptospira noguchii]
MAQKNLGFVGLIESTWEDSIMFHKKIAVALLLTLFFANCDSKKDDDSTTNLLLLAAIQSQQPDASGVYAALSMLRRSNNNPGQQGAYSNGKVSPFSVASDQTKDCTLGGSMKMSLGNMTQGQGANGVFTLEYTGSKLTFQNCKESAPSAEKGGSSEVATFNGEIARDGIVEAILDIDSLDPNSGSFKYTQNSTEKMYSDSYSVNGVLYPKIDLTFKVSNGKYAASNLNDIDKATLSVEETVEVTGTIGEGKVKESYTTKYTINFK